jgi:predicted HD phosphohydrolase
MKQPQPAESARFGEDTPSSPEYTREEMRDACKQNYRAGVLAERERCARIAEYFDQLPPATIASAIRNENIGESKERTSAHD